jgi:hypothetical protein
VGLREEALGQSRHLAQEQASQPEPEPQEHWERYADPRFENGKEGDDRSMRERLRFLDELPDDPAAVLKKVRAYYPSGKGDPVSEGEHDMGALSVLFASQPMPPQALAKLYRALAAVPGAESPTISYGASRAGTPSRSGTTRRGRRAAARS